MTIFGISLKGTFATNIKVLAFPSILAISLIVLSILVFKNGVSRIYEKLDELEELDKTVSTLEEKVGILRQIEGIVLEQVDTSLVSLPEKNPSMISLQQLENLAQNKGIEIINKTSKGKQSALPSLFSGSIDLELTGQLQNLLNFLQDLDTIAPITTIAEINIKGEENGVSSSSALSVYWGTYPTKIPPITEPIKTLTQNEENLLGKLTALNKPDLVKLEAQAPSTRVNPFQ